MIPRFLTDGTRYYACPKYNTMLIKSDIDGILKCCNTKCKIKVKVVNSQEYIRKAKLVYKYMEDSNDI